MTKWNAIDIFMRYSVDQRFVYFIFFCNLHMFVVNAWFTTAEITVLADPLIVLSCT